MTNQEAIEILSAYYEVGNVRQNTAMDMAISALREQDLQPTRNQLATNTIDRQAAIDAVNDLPNCRNGYSDTYDKSCIIGLLEDMPSAQPEPCEDAVSRTELRHIFEEHCYPVHYDHNSVDEGRRV